MITQSRTMIRSRAKLALLVVLSAVLLFPRLGGAHLHFCLDGAESAVGLRTFDMNGSESLIGVDEDHQDQKSDVDADSPVLVKLWPPHFDGALVLIVLVWVVRFRLNVPIPALHAILVPESPLFLRPPLRGPPV
jgi:hypothetical protein